MLSVIGNGIRAVAALFALLSAPVRAVDAIVFEAKEMRFAGTVTHGLVVRLTPGADAKLAAQATAAQVNMGSTLGTLQQFRFVCPQARLAEPSFGCSNARMSANGSPIGALAMRSDLVWRSDTTSLVLTNSGQKFAGGTLNATANSDPRGWRLSAQTNKASVAGLRSFLSAWAKLPATVETSGSVQLDFSASGVAAADRADLSVKLTALNFGNQDATVAGENIAANLQLALQRAGSGYDVISNVSSSSGQALLTSVLLDFRANPLQASARGRWQDALVTLPEIKIEQLSLARASGHASLRLAGAPYVPTAEFKVEDLRFPAAYNSFLQIALAAGDFGALTTTGKAQGKLLIANDAVAEAEINLQDIDISEQKGKFSMRKLRGGLHWRPQSAPAPAESWLEWQSGSAYGLSGGVAKLQFIARGLDFELARPARIPIFDGALRIDSFAAQDLTTPQVTMRFNGEIEPISMPLLSKAFGWPELAGQLAGRIPSVEYRDKLLTFSGDVEARVFNGRVIGSKLRLKDPLGAWPRLYADVRARDLDMGLVTRTFSIGSITGKLEADILGLELFNWSPVAFDASLRTPANDRGQHRISAKAVGNLSNIGGGGGGVAKALQSGAFKFFDEYDYQRVGLRCKLENEVCLMCGLEPTGIGYYILEGKGLPHIDIVGNAGRVNWPQLVSQIGTQMRGEGQLTIK